jgi:CRISPR-associated exonuclease Cas4
VAVYDKDHQAYKGQDAKNSADISSSHIEQEIDRTIGKTVILNNDIEEEVGIQEKHDKNKPFIALQEVSKSDFELPESLEAKIIEIYD